jgi:hypothetical protein
LALWLISEKYVGLQRVLLSSKYWNNEFTIQTFAAWIHPELFQRINLYLMIIKLSSPKFLCLFLLSPILFLLVFSSVQAQSGLTLSDYIEKYKDIAMEEMRKNGIPASIKLGQGILESGFGNSPLAVNANNHFGIKCHGWTGRSFYKDDDKPDECFRAYDDPMQSFRDHSEFLTGRPRYSGLFELDIQDYKGWARGLRRAGYATNPRYPELLIRVIEQNKLYEFDRLVLSTGDYDSWRICPPALATN